MNTTHVLDLAQHDGKSWFPWGCHYARSASETNITAYSRPYNRYQEISRVYLITPNPETRDKKYCASDPLILAYPTSTTQTTSSYILSMCIFLVYINSSLDKHGDFLRKHCSPVE